MTADSIYAGDLYRAQNGVCPWCSLPLPRDFTDVHVDHIIPKCRGGPNRAWNRQLLHGTCNSRKGKTLTRDAEVLAAEHGVALRLPKPTSWPGSNLPYGNRA